MKELSESQLSRLERAYEVRRLSKPFLKRGDMSKTDIYYNVILKKHAMCENTFRTLLDLSEADEYPQLLREYRRLKRARYMARLKRRCNTRKDNEA